MKDFSMVELFPCSDDAYDTHQEMRSIVLSFCNRTDFELPINMPTDSFVCYFVLGAMGALDVSEVGLASLDRLLTNPNDDMQDVINQLEALYNSLDDEN